MRIRVYVVALLVIASAVACYAAWVQLRRAPKTERFESPGDDDEKPTPADRKKADDEYDRRLFVLQAFESSVKRKPTEEELDKYSRLKSNASIKSAIAKLDDGGKKAAPVAVVETYDDNGDCSSSSDEDDDDVDDKWMGRRKAAAAASRTCDGSKEVGEPKPYSPDRVHRATEASSDNAWGKIGATSSDNKRVCMDRSDLMHRLEGIAREVEQFRQFVAMM